MALSNAVEGATHTAQQITWVDGDGDPLNLTGATITARIKDLDTGDGAGGDRYAIGSLTPRPVYSVGFTVRPTWRRRGRITSSSSPRSARPMTRRWPSYGKLRRLL
jgi:hypothetical protein